jgi:hypothetical protein
VAHERPAGVQSAQPADALRMATSDQAGHPQRAPFFASMHNQVEAVCPRVRRRPATPPGPRPVLSGRSPRPRTGPRAGPFGP